MAVDFFPEMFDFVFVSIYVRIGRNFQNEVSGEISVLADVVASQLNSLNWRLNGSWKENMHRSKLIEWCYYCIYVRPQCEPCTFFLFQSNPAHWLMKKLRAPMGSTVHNFCSTGYFKWLFLGTPFSSGNDNFWKLRELPVLQPKCNLINSTLLGTSLSSY